MKPFCAAVDWGTSSFRLWLLARDSTVLAERRSGEGMMTAIDAGFASILEGHLDAAGADRSLPVVVCGMAGARQGWREAGYVDVPARLDDVAAAAIRVENSGRDIRILPGIAQRDPHHPDVMRGEETQLLGLMAQGIGSGLACLPGTHSKWVVVDRGKVVRFATFMTGEIFSILKSHSILRLTMAADGVSPDGPGFAEAVLTAHASPQEITNRLFALRAGALLAKGGAGLGAAGLSGLLIGLELAGASSLCGKFREVTLVAAGELAALYARALEAVGAAVNMIDAEAAVRRGLWHAARRIWDGS